MTDLVQSTALPGAVLCTKYGYWLQTLIFNLRNNGRLTLSLALAQVM
jgi:hypothetical protein